jgi:hypothetical protein
VAIFEKLHSRAHDGEASCKPSICSNSTAEDWRPRPLIERKARLERLIVKAPAGIQYSEHLDSDLATQLAASSAASEPHNKWIILCSLHLW